MTNDPLVGLFCLFGLRLYVPVNNFFSNVGTEPQLPWYLGITSTLMEVNISSFKDTTRRPESGSNPRPLGVRRPTTRPPRLPPLVGNDNDKL